MVNRRRAHCLRALAGLALTTLLAGCGAAGAGDPQDAQAVLIESLDAWKSGTTISQAIEQTGTTIADPKWAAGYRLSAYEVAGPPEAAGFDLSYPVRLDLQDPTGRKSREMAAFTVSTRPARTVIRDAFATPQPRLAQQP